MPSILVLAGILLAAPAYGQAVSSREPTSTHIFPAGGKRGSIVKVRVGGECLPPGMSFKLLGGGVMGPSILGAEVKARYEPSLRRLPRDADGVGANMAYPREFDASVAIAADAEVGARFWRISGGWGGTRPRPFLVGDLPEFIETEPNSQPELAERIALPMVVNGQIAGERDQDFFVFAAKAGDVIVCDVLAARIGSPLEAVVAITDAAGKTMDIDELRVGGDPVVSFRAPANGDYRLHVANLGFGGGPAYVYRITVSTRPYAAFAFPPAGKAGETREIDVFSLSGSGSLRVAKESIAFPARPGVFHLRDSLRLMASEAPEVVEAVGNQSANSAMELTTPVTVNARFLKADEEDWFRFSAKKGEAFTIAALPFPRDSAAVPMLTIFDPSGAAIAKAGNIETPELGFDLDWRAPADGIYKVRMRDLQHGARGGPEFIYRLTVRAAQPDFTLKLDPDYVNVVQGGRTEIDLIVQRTGGFTGPIDLSIAGLPDGVKLEPTRVADNQTRVKLAVIAKDDARPTDAVVRIAGKALIAGKAVERKAGVPSFGWDGDTLHVTVQHKPVFKLSCNEAYQYAHRGSIYPYTMKIERLDGFNGPITLQLCDRQVQDLDGIEVIETVIPPDAKEAKNLIYLPETMHSSVQHHCRPYAQAYARFTDKWGQKQTLLATSQHRCMIRTLPPVVKLRAVSKEIAARPGEVIECKVVLDRAAFTGPAEVTLVEQAGFKAEKVRIEPGQNEATVRVLVANPSGDQVLTFRATGSLGSGATAITEARVAVRMK